ncbi:hypothetical protein [Psychroserpens sp. Hel_I_66]|uniref:hypothetical protein n=1 Tax=Psychroserpens sp. Hel_I_66 TaxID=1250004 RepID=UPI000647B45C|nr:hypothetical protein [Psychroserpens sp. Hel_I_66]
MNAKILFYSLFALMFAGSISLTEMDNSKLADVVTVASTVSSDELRSPAEKREEGYELQESQAEYDLPDAITTAP